MIPWFAKRFKYLALLLILTMAVLVIKESWPAGGQEAIARDVAARTVLPDAALQRQNILEELQLIRKQLDEIQKDLKSGDLVFKAVIVEGQVAGEGKSAEKAK